MNVAEPAGSHPPYDDIPLSVSQESMWILWQADPDRAAYLITLPLQVRGELEPERLRRAVAELGELHPTLRGRVVETERGTRLSWSGAPDIPVVERRTTEPATEAVRRYARMPFDLRRGPLARVDLLRGPDYLILLISCHHIVLDASGCGFLLRELSAAYAGGPLPKADDPGVLATFAERQWTLANGPEGEPHRRFWREHLGEDVPPLHLPTPPPEGARPEFLHTSLDAELVRRAEELADNLGVHRLVPFYAACTILIGRYSGQTDLVLGTTYHGRRDADLQEQVGFFSNTLPLRHRLPRHATYREVMLNLYRDLVSAALYGELPLPVMLREAGLGGEAARRTTNRVLFQYWSAPSAEVVDVVRVPLHGIEGEATLRLLPTEDLADYGLTVFLREDSDGATMTWKDPEGLVGPTLLEHLAADYPQVLRELVETPDRALSEPASSMTSYLDRLRDDEDLSLAGTAGLPDAAHPFTLPSGVPAAARRLDVTVHEWLLAAVAGVLSWYTGRERLRAGVAPPGGSAAPLPIRLDVSNDEPFDRLVKRTADELGIARRVRWPSAPYVESLLDGQDPYGPALVAFGDAEQAVADGGSRLRVTLDTEGTGGRVEPGQGGPDGAAFAEHLCRFVSAVLADPERAVGDVEPLCEQEREQEQAWNETSARYPEVALPDLLRERAAAEPDAVALTGESGSVTYGALFERVEALARGLVSRGVRPGDLVGLLLPRGRAQVEAILAVLFAGGAYVPIDVATPQMRRRFILADCGARWLVAAGSGPPAGETDDFSGEVIALEDLAEGTAADGGPAPLPEIDPDAVAYVIYTSGTTGHPKGVLVSHRNVVRLVVNDRLPFEFGPHDVWTLFHSYAFDFSVWELFGCLAHGGRLVIVSEGQAKDTERFFDLVRRERVTVLNQTPSAFAQLCTVEGDEPDALDRLRYVIFGGERLRPRSLAGFAARHPAVALVNMYGITETTVHVTVRYLTAEDIAEDRGSIGVPIPTTTVHLMDARGRLLPTGAVGEICVGGLGVTRGYLGRPELTVERFVPDPFGPGHLYRSGDLARRMPDGTLEVIGRADGQLKVRGYRIEPGEIEARLQEHPGVLRAAVALDDGRLTGYVQPRDAADGSGAKLDPDDLSEHLRESLPGYMVPAAFAGVPGFPLTVNGKLDWAALRASAVRLDSRTESAPAHSPTAREIAGIWSELLGVPAVGAEDSFFGLGGNSLDANHVIRAVEARLEVRVPVRVLFERPRLRDFADAVDRHGTADERRGEPEPLPATSMQRQIWLAERLEPGRGLYQAPLIWNVAGVLDEDRLAEAFTRVIARHEPLRTRFVEQDGRLCQVVGPAWRPEVERHDLRGLDADERDRRIATMIEDGVDPASGRPLRVALADVDGDGEGGEKARAQLLIVRFHHLAWDAESTGPFLRDLREHYGSDEGPVEDGAADAPAVWPTDAAGQIARIWSELLDVPAPADDDSFFDLGGKSLVGARMLARVEERLGVRLPLRALFENPRLRDFAETVELRRADDFATADAGVEEADTGPADARSVPASGFQERIWFAARLEPDTAIYHVPLAWRVAGRLAPERLEAALARVVERHEILRTRFVERDGRVRQVVGEPWQPAIQYHDLRDVPSWERRHLVDELLDRALRERFEPRSGRLLRALLLDLGDDLGDGGQLFFLCVHHLVWDGESAVPFLHDLASAYGPATSGPTGPAGTQYREVVARLAAPRPRSDLDYWTEQLAGAPAYPPIEPPDPHEPHGAVTVPLPGDARDRMRRVQNDGGVSAFMVVATVLAAALHRWTARADLTFGVPSVDRGDAAPREVVGPCLNSLVLRSRSRPADTFGDLLGRMRDTVLGALEHREVPFEDVVELLNPVRRVGWTPYLDVSLNMIAQPSGWPSVGGHELTWEPLDWVWRHEVKMGLTFSLTDDGDRLTGFLSYRGDRYRRADVERLADWLGRALGAVDELLDQPLDALEEGPDSATTSAASAISAAGAVEDAAGPAPTAARARFQDFVLAEMAAQHASADLAYWAGALEGAPAYLEMPAAAGSDGQGAVPIPMTREVSDGLRQRCSEEGVTVHQLLAAGLAAALHEWTRQDDLTFGTPMACRDRDEFADLVGPLMNPVALRSIRTPDSTLRDVLLAVQSTMLDAHEHSAVPFASVVERLAPPRRMGRTPYIDVMLTVENEPAEPVTLGGHRLTTVPTDRYNAGYLAKFALTAYFCESGGAFTGSLAYRGDRLTGQDAEALAGLLGRTLERFAGDLDAPLGDGTPMTPEEQVRLAAFEQGAPAAPVSAATTVPALVAEQAVRCPDAPAVRCGSGVLTYAELHARAKSLSARIRPLARRSGSGPSEAREPVVALFLGRGENLIVAMLASWYAGCAFCPIDPDYPDERSSLLLGDCGARAVVADAGTAPSTDLPVLSVTENVTGDTAEAGEENRAEEPTAPDPSAVAYVIYTSGTTGVPKGVMVTHGGLAQLVRWHIDAFEVTAADVASHMASVGFDASQWEVWPYLVAGACLVPHEHRVLVPEVPGWLDEHRITMAFLPTPVAESVWGSERRPSALRWMLYGAAPLTGRPPSGLPYSICNNYGPTEATVVAACRPGVPPADGPPNVIGRPIAGASVRVLDEAGRRCPIGVAGEIYIGGSGVAAGYLGRPELTEERFVTPPGGERMYRTGDRGRWLPDGDLEYLGRVDRQLKVRGHRVEPQEVEHHLLADPRVARAFVHGDDVRLVAYLVPAPGVERASAPVLAGLAGRVPAHLVPDSVVWLDELPTSAHGKVAVERLPRPGADASRTGRDRAGPTTDLERRVAAVWAAVLGHDRVGVHDNFFDLGGNSMLLAGMHARLQQELDREIPIQRLFQHPTVHSLAVALTGDGAADGADGAVAAADPGRPDDGLRERAERARRSRAARGRGGRSR
ncbi:amino acid adenylation domain-containing protein [Spirillospora sp. CA-255316]